MSLTKMQQEYLDNCNHRWNVKTGATGSGKSYVDYTVTIPQRLLALKGEGLAVLLGNTRGTLERNILEPMRNIWGNELVGEIRSDNTVQLFGRKVYALGADNKKHVARIQGATMEYVYGDEVTTWAQDVFEMLKSRLRCKHSRFDGTCNPDNPNHWFKQFLDSDADIFQQAYTIDDGCLPPEVVEELKKEYSGKVFYGRYIEGRWCAADGLVYDMFSPDIHIIDDADTESDYYVSSDFGIQNATVFLLWRKERDSNRWVCINEWYYSGRENKVQKTVEQLVTGMETILPRTEDGEIIKPRQIIVDPSAAALIVEMRRKQYHVIPAENDVLDGIADVSTMLSQNRLAFCRRCKNTVNEFGVYAWDAKAAARGVDAVIKENDHAMDAVRYLVRTKHLVKVKTEYRSVFF